MGKNNNQTIVMNSTQKQLAPVHDAKSAAYPNNTAAFEVAIKTEIVTSEALTEIETLPAGVKPDKGFEGLSQKEQMQRHLDYLGLGEDGCEIVVDLAACGERQFHRMVLARVSRDGDSLDPGANLHVYDSLTTQKKKEKGELPPNTLLGTHNWLREITNKGDEKGEKYQVYFKPNKFKGAGHTVGKQNVLATRAFVGEADCAGGTITEQYQRVQQLVKLGVRFNAVVDSGGKSIHVFIRAPKGMDVDWERDERIQKKLAVALKGDPRVINRDRSMRLAGFDRPGRRPQALLGGCADHFYATVAVLEATIDQALEQLGVDDWEEAFKALAQQGTYTDHLSTNDFGNQPCEQMQSGPGSPCPVCGRDTTAACTIWVSGNEDDSRLGVNCFHGDTFSPPRTKDLGNFGGEQPLDRGDVIPGMFGKAWAFVRESQGGLGPFSVFLEDRSLERALKKSELAKRGGAVTPGCTAPIDRPLTLRDLQKFHLLIEDNLTKKADGTDQPWITVNGETFRWADTHYERVAKEDLVRLIVDIAKSITWFDNNGREYHPFTKSSEVQNAISWFMQATIINPARLNPSGFVNCLNGVVRITWEGNHPCASLEPHDPEVHLFVDSPGLHYNPDANPEHVDRMLKCLPQNGREAFLQVVSATLDTEAIRRMGHRVPAMMLIGQGQNGKDTLREAVTMLHGHSSVACIGISDWQQYEAGQGRGRFTVEQLDRARLSIASENSGAFKIDNLESLKAAITGEPLYVERKGQDGKLINPKAAFLFFLNRPPLVDGGTEAIISRWVVVNMPHSYSTNPREGQLKADPRFKHNREWMTTEVLPAFLNLLIQSLGDVAANGIDIESCAEEMQKLREDTSHLHSFLKVSGYELGDSVDCVQLTEIYQDLNKYYIDEGWKQHKFSEWVFIEDGDGDKPVKSQRLLTKRLQQLYPTIFSLRGTDKQRRTVLYGIRKRK